MVQKKAQVLEALKERYKHLHPLLFLRSKERARSNGELFDILESIEELPVVWDEVKRRWVHTELFHVNKVERSA